MDHKYFVTFGTIAFSFEQASSLLQWEKTCCWNVDNSRPGYILLYSLKHEACGIRFNRHVAFK